VGSAVVGLANCNGRLINSTEIGMNKIKERSIINVREQVMHLFLLDLIPPHMRHNQLFPEPAHTPGQKTEAASLPKLFGFLKQQLHTDANSEKRRTSTCAFNDDAIKASVRECFHTGAK